MKECVLLFVKNPEKGKVKTRLAKDLDEGVVQTLYRNFVFDMLDTLTKNNFHFIICFHPPEAGAGVSKCFGKNYKFMPQKGDDLGQRMKNAFASIFNDGFSKAVITGSDIPDLSNDTIEEAFRELETHDAVIGPSYDGGYYLIGFRADTFAPDIFEEIKWGSGDVFKDTMKIFNENKCSVHILQEMRDVDTIEDLAALYEKNKFTDFAESGTMRFISGLK